MPRIFRRPRSRGPRPPARRVVGRRRHARAGRFGAARRAIGPRIRRLVASPPGPRTAVP